MPEYTKGNNGGAGSLVAPFFSQLTTARDGPDSYSPHAVLLRRVTDRADRLATHFSSRESFSNYLAQHPLSPAITVKIAKEVALRQRDLSRIEEQEKIDQLDGEPPSEQYRLLAMLSYVDPGAIFPDIPSLLQLCELNDLHDYHRYDGVAQAVIADQWGQVMAYIRNRWRALTGEELADGRLPVLSELMRLIAPVPARPAWSVELYTREARSLGHVAQPPAIGRLNGLQSALTGGGQPPAGQPPAGTDSTRASDTAPVPSAGTDREEPQPCTLDGRCSLETLNKLAGAPPLRQPDRGEPATARYTFPGELGHGEDIFYDYAVMVPLPECGPFLPQIVGWDYRNMAAAQLLATRARGLLQFLKDENLADALGVLSDDGNPPNPQTTPAFMTVVAHLESLLNDVLFNFPSDSPVVAARKLRGRLNEAAALVRAISRNSLPFHPVDPNQLLAAVESAVQNFPQFEQRWTRVPTAQNGQDHPEAINGFLPQTFINTLKINAREVPQNSHLNSYGQGDNARLREYFTEAVNIYPELTSLKDAAAALAAAVRNWSHGAALNAPSAQFQRLAEALLHDVTFALARLLDEIAEAIPLDRLMASAGSMRLALMVTFRQYWHPEGYIQGKLVGYKNLAPNQKETVKRRTFVKTTREVSTAEEFLASREEDFSRSSKETAEVLRESSSQFNLTASAGGTFDILVGGLTVNTQTGLQLHDLSRQTQNRVAEATMKSSAKFSEKREVKVRQLTEIEDVQEVTSELANLNREITANYFYYQLLRQYVVTMELHELRPVLLRARDIPAPASIDDKFVADYAHILIHALPAQLTVDLQETVSEIETLARAMIRRRADLDESRAAYEQFVLTPAPEDTAGATRWQAQMDSRERLLAQAKDAFVKAEDDFLRARSRLDRVISHIRENRTYYSQFIWRASPTVDEDRLLQLEQFNGASLPEVTRGLSRLGYFGNEEIFEYTGQSLALLDILVRNLESGADLLRSAGSSGPRGDLVAFQTPLVQQLIQYYVADDISKLNHRISSQAFFRDPVDDGDMFNARRVQISQDALVVETLPGQVPLLEGFQMAHRILDVQKACLENIHLNERIKDRPWKQDGSDTYRVYRRDGETASQETNVDVMLSGSGPRAGGGP
jgi:hypothetical protein